MAAPRKLRRPAAREPVPIPDDAVLTQYGMLDPAGQPIFRSAPRYPREVELSMLWGELDVAEAAQLVRKRPAVGDDLVRHCRAGDLRARGFEVDHTPSLSIPNHVSVTVAAGHVQWDTEQESTFAELFLEPWKGAVD